MTDCWLEGYADVLFSLSKNIDISGADPKDKNVAIVWNLFDRWEGDCIGNVQELKRIVEALWLNCVSLWLDGWNFDDLQEIKHASTILSLPYGRKAAKKIAKRLKADIVELDVPFGLDQTGEFIRKIADHFSLQDTAESFIKKELTEYNKLEIVKWAIPHTFSGKKMWFYGDPYLLNGFLWMAKTLGFTVPKIFVHGDEKHFNNVRTLSFDLEDIKENIEYWLNWDVRVEGLDLFVLNSHHHTSPWSVPFMEFWFPSYYHHVYTYQPYYGYRWTLNFMNRVSNTITQS